MVSHFAEICKVDLLFCLWYNNTKKALKGSIRMNLKRIICLFLAALLLFGVVAGAISLLVMNASAADITTVPSSAADPADPSGEQEQQEQQENLKNGDKIVIFILGAIVPCVIFLIMIVKVVWRGK